eukprot:15485638-Alexandrium_andersonii.AAC.1
MPKAETEHLQLAATAGINPHLSITAVLQRGALSSARARMLERRQARPLGHLGHRGHGPSSHGGAELSLA